MREPPGWHARGYLPHFNDGASLQAITYRLSDALPVEVVARLEEQALGDEQRRAEIERWLDAGHGSCVLREAVNADAVVAAWQHDHGVAYLLRAWVVTPNHVHVLIEPLGEKPIGEIVGAWKSVSARKILSGSAATLGRNETKRPGAAALPRKRHLWQPDYWDRFIRNERHYRATVEYIHANAVKSGLVTRAEDWPWSGAAKTLTI